MSEHERSRREGRRRKSWFVERERAAALDEAEAAAIRAELPE